MVYPMLIFLTIYMLFFFDHESQTIIYTGIEINPYDAPNEGILLNQSTPENPNDMKLDMIILVNNETYDNDDNPYGKFILHMYTNMKDILDRSTDTVDEDGNPSETLYGFEDREIPLVICPTQMNTSWRKSNIK